MNKALTRHVSKPMQTFVVAPGILFLQLSLAAIRMIAIFAQVVFASIFIRVGMSLLFWLKEEKRWAMQAHYLRFNFIMFKFVLGIKTNIYGGLPQTGSLVVSNHKSYLDIIVLGSILETFQVGKVDVQKWPLIGPGGKAAGIIYVKRENRGDRKNTLYEVQRRLDAGYTMVNFPEGTTTDEALPMPFKPGMFYQVAGQELLVYPVTLQYMNRDSAWVGDDTFVDHVFKMAMKFRHHVTVTFSIPVKAAQYSDGEQLKSECYKRVCNPVLPESMQIEKELSWLRIPWKKSASHQLRKGEYTIRLYDQPGRWMLPLELDQLKDDLIHIAHQAMDEIPQYGIFTGEKSAYANRVFSVAYHNSGKPVAFTAMVYMPYCDKNQLKPLIHLGLTMISKEHRGKRLQTPLFKKIFIMPVCNQRRLKFAVTNIAASPAGIGAMSDYFQDVYPHYHQSTTCTDYHKDIASFILNNYRHEFGCSDNAYFDEESFIVHGSNDPDGGGAYQFIKDDPVSQYRVEACNVFCRQRLHFNNGDEQFQVGKIDFFKAMWASRNAKRKPKKALPVATIH